MSACFDRDLRRRKSHAVAITIRLVDDFFNPIAGYPREDMWLEFVPGPGTIVDCARGQAVGCFLADGATDPTGRATFSLPLDGGGTINLADVVVLVRHVGARCE